MPSVSADPIAIYPGNDCLYYMDFTRRLHWNDDTIESVDSVQIMDENDAPLSGLDVDSGSLEPNGDEFFNSQGNTVAEGKAALFRCSGAVKDVDYYAAVTITTASGDEITRVGLFKARTR